MANNRSLNLKYALKMLQAIPQGAENEKLKQHLLYLNGKLVTAEDPFIVGKNFRTLTNMRYSDESPITIGGMTKINSTTSMHGTSFHPRSAIHFRKIQPAESPSWEDHIVVQSWGTAGTSSIVIQNTAIPPGTGGFGTAILWTDSTSAGIGRFAEAPGGKLAYANGVDTCLYTGNGIPCTAMITSTTEVTDTVTSPRDYSEAMLNTRTDAQNIAIIGGGNDLRTVLLLHCDGTGGTAVKDVSFGYGTSGTVGTSGTCKAILIGGDLKLDTSQAKFGLSSMHSTSGTNGYCYVPSADADIDHFFMGTDACAFDFWIKLPDPLIGSDHGIYDQNDGAGNSFSISLQGLFLYIEVYQSGVRTLFVNGGFAVSAMSDWVHYLVRRPTANSEWEVYRNGVYCVAGGVTGTGGIPNINANVDIGRFRTTAGIYGYFPGNIDEFRVSKSTGRSNVVPARAYSTSSRTWLVRSPLPIQGGEIYIKTGNTITSTLTIKEYNGYSWSTLTQLTNTGTVGGVALAQTGSFTVASTVSTSKLKWIEGNLGYWYQFTLSDGEAEIYYITLDPPMQQIVDIWNGIERPIAAFFKYTSTYTDYSQNVYTDEYVSGDTSTYADLSSLAAYDSATGQNCVYMGFFERQAGFNIGVPSNKANATDGVISLDYWDGSTFTETAHAVDGTSETGHPLAKPGTISFTIPDPWNVFKRTMANNSTPLYYYRLRSTGAMTNPTAIYYVAGIPAPKTIRGYKFPLYSQDCTMLCCNMDGKRNSILISEANTSQIYNGDNSSEIEFGTDEELNAGCTVFSQYGSNLFNITMFFKDREIWNLVWNGSAWQKYCVAKTIGCQNNTLDTIIIPPIEGEKQANRCIAIWEAADGVYISDGRHPVEVSHDIRDLWNQNSPVHINQSYQRYHHGHIDQSKKEYHIFLALTSGTVTYLDSEYVLDLRRWKWFKVDRTTGKYLQVAINVIDQYGINHSYGFTESGYMMRLEYGQSFDGEAITSTWQTGHFSLDEKEVLNESELKMIVPIMKTKDTTADITFTDYVDTAEVGTEYTLNSVNDGYGISTPVKGLNSIPGICHSIKASITTDEESVGFEPFVVGLFYQTIRKRNYPSSR